jgi:hypothetical protein
MTPQDGPAQMEAWMKPGIKGRRDVSVTAIVDRMKARLNRVHATAGEAPASKVSEAFLWSRSLVASQA